MARRASTDEKAIRKQGAEKAFEALEIEVEDAAHAGEIFDTVLEKRDQGRIDFPRELGDPHDLERGEQVPEASQAVEETETERSRLA